METHFHYNGCKLCVAAGPNGELWSSVPLGWTKTWTLIGEMGDK